MKYKDLEDEWTQHWFQFILDNLDKPWDWSYLSGNPNITWEIIQANPDKEWNWDFISGNPNITTDIIVGFPGESQEEWQESYNFIKEIQFSHIHIFAYSMRIGTKASILDNHIETFIKKQRSKKLHNLAKTMRKRILNNQVGKEHFVLWESKDNKDIWSGYTKNYYRIKLKEAQKNLKNKISKIIPS